MLFDINGTDETSRTALVGDSPSDMEFGKNLGMVTVFLGEESNMQEINSDFVYKDLWDMSKVLF